MSPPGQSDFVAAQAPTSTWITNGALLAGSVARFRYEYCREAIAGDLSGGGGDWHGLCTHGDSIGKACVTCVRPLKACILTGCMCCQLSYDLKRMLHPVSP